MTTASGQGPDDPAPTSKYSVEVPGAQGVVIGENPHVTQIFQSEAPTPVPEALHQLPADPPHFTGRVKELARLRALLPEGTARTVVISAIAGTAGVGKTALALHLAHELVPTPAVQMGRAHV